jgi:hypothetical protein
LVASKFSPKRWLASLCVALMTLVLLDHAVVDANHGGETSVFYNITSIDCASGGGSSQKAPATHHQHHCCVAHVASLPQSQEASAVDRAPVTFSPLINESDAPSRLPNRLERPPRVSISA